MGTRFLFNSFAVLTLCVSCALAQSNGANMEPTKKDWQSSCEDFSKFARFNPNSVVGKWWFIFYYWGQPPISQHYFFRVPTSRQDSELHILLDDKVLMPVNWTSRRLLLSDDRNKTELLVEVNDRGFFDFYILPKRVSGAQVKIAPIRLQLKQVAGGRYIGLLNCFDQTAYVMSALDDVPNRKELHDAAATTGFRAPRGRSYLYKGHEWMPIGDSDFM